MTYSLPGDPDYTLTDEELQGQAEALANVDPVAPTAPEVEAAQQQEILTQQSSTEETPSAGAVAAQSSVTQPTPESTDSQQATEQPTAPLPETETTTDGAVFGEAKTVKQDPGSAWLEERAKETYKELPADVKANLALGLGTWDTLANATNNLVYHMGGSDYYQKVPTAGKHESKNFELVREIGSFVGPEMMLLGGGGLTGLLPMIKNSRLLQGSVLLSNPHLRRLGNLMVAGGTARAVSENSPYITEKGNIADLAPRIPIINKVMPKQLDWVADNYGTMGETDPDIIKQRNLNLDVGLASVIPFMQFFGGIGRATYRGIKGKTDIAIRGVDVPDAAARSKSVSDAEFQLANQDATVTVDNLAITANNANTEDWLRQASPDSVETAKQAEAIWMAEYDQGALRYAWNDLTEEIQQKAIEGFIENGAIVPRSDMSLADQVVRTFRDQDSALDELGRYNLAQSVGEDISLKPMKGVNDLYDFNEIGMRTLDDFGVVGAKIDAARILNNAGSTNGRIRNMVSPAAMKYAAKNLDAVDDITLGLGKNLSDANDFSAKGSAGWKLTNQMMDDAADNLMIEFLDPTLDVNGLKRMLSPVLGKADDGTDILLPRGNELVKNQIAKLGQELSDLDVARAQAYVGTSLAGQISDVAEAARYNRGTVAVAAAQEKITENMAFLMRLKASTNYYMNRKSNIRNLWKTEKVVEPQTAEELVSNYETAMRQVNEEINQAMMDLKWTFNNEPELGEAIMELYEATDGRVFDIKTIQDTANQSLGWARPRFSNTDPETPNLVGQAIRGNWFNSMLSAVGTPVRATLGNFGGIIDEPVSYLAGAVLRQDWDSVSKGMYAYRAFGDVQKKAFPLMGKLYTKAAQNLDTVERATDLDFAIKTDKKLEGLRKLANNEAAKGNTGYSVMLEQYITLNEMAMDPVLRLNGNLMTGLDGLPQSMYANSEARFMALEEMARQGEDFNPEEILAIANKEYNSMFDETGNLLKNQAAKYGADRISLRRNTAMSEGLNDFLKKYPSARILFPFPGTQANIISLVDETIPLPFRSWQKDINDLAYTSMDTFSENPGLVRRVLENRGYNVDAMDEIAQLGAITRLKNKTLGRKALSTGLIGGAIYAVTQDRLTGEGLYDKQAQQARELANIPKNSFKMPGGEWVAIDSILGPGYGRWVSIVATAAENFNYLGEQNFSNLEKKLGFFFGAAIKDDSGLSAVEPIFKMLNGESYSLNKFASNQINSLGPLGGFRNEMGEVLNGGLRIVENDMMSMMKNRNKALGLVTPKADNPYIINPLDGSVPNQYTFMQRFWNTISDIKVTPELTENGLFMKNAGMSYSQMFDTVKGVDLTSDEQERLYEIVGEQGILNKELTKIRKYAERINYVERLKAFKASGATDEQLENFEGVNDMWRKALSEAKGSALLLLEFEMAQPINERIYQKEQEKLSSQIGDTQAFIDELPTR